MVAYGLEFGHRGRSLVLGDEALSCERGLQTARTRTLVVRRAGGSVGLNFLGWLKHPLAFEIATPCLIWRRCCWQPARTDLSAGRVG